MNGATPRTQKRQEICQRRLNYLLKNGERLLKCNGNSTYRLDSPNPSLSAGFATPEVSGRSAEQINWQNSHGNQAGNPFQAAQERFNDQFSKPTESADVDEEEDPIESEFHTHRPEPDLSLDDEIGLATSRSTELLVETQRNHLQDILQQSMRSANEVPTFSSLKQTASVRPHLRSRSYNQQQLQQPRPEPVETNAFIRDLEQRHRLRQSRQLPDYDAILRELDDELDSATDRQQQQQQQQDIKSHLTPPFSSDRLRFQQQQPQQQQQRSVASLRSLQYLHQQQQQQQQADYQRHLDAVKWHHEDLQRRVAEEWTEQRLRESNSRASLERYFASLRHISPRSEAEEIAQQFEPVPDSPSSVAATSAAPPSASSLILCPDCGEACDAKANLSWCQNCGCCLIVDKRSSCQDVEERLPTAPEEKEENSRSGEPGDERLDGWETVSESSSGSGVSSTVTSLPAIRRHSWKQQRDLLPPDLLQQLRLNLPVD